MFWQGEEIDMVLAGKDFHGLKSVPFIWLLALTMLMGGCSVGPQLLKGNRYDYNLSIQKSNNEELILNIVRTRYAESIFFLQVGSIASHFGYSSSIGLSSSMDRLSGAANPASGALRPSIGATFSESPTITYTPMQGEKAIRLLQSELTLDRFQILAQIGWDIEVLMWLVVDKIGATKNMKNDMLNGNLNSEDYGIFLDLAQHLSRIQRRGDLEFLGFYKKEGEVDRLSVQLRFLDQQEADQVEGLLNVRPERVAGPGGRIVSKVVLTSVDHYGSCWGAQVKCNQVPVKLRSFFNILLGLSYYVEISPAEQTLRIVRPFQPLPDDFAHRSGPHKGLVRVKAQSAYPDNAYIAIPYRSHWFYLADDDVQSKIFLSLVKTIYSLQSGDLQTVEPILTIPVGR